MFKKLIAHSNAFLVQFTIIKVNGLCSANCQKDMESSHFSSSFLEFYKLCKLKKINKHFQLKWNLFFHSYALILCVVTTFKIYELFKPFLQLVQVEVTF